MTIVETYDGRRANVSSGAIFTALPVPIGHNTPIALAMALAKGQALGMMQAQSFGQGIIGLSNVC